jgi:hypothetical protein
VPERGVVLGVQVEPLAEGRDIDGRGQAVAEVPRVEDHPIRLREALEGLGVFAGPPEGGRIGRREVVVGEQAGDPRRGDRPDRKSGPRR